MLRLVCWKCHHPVACVQGWHLIPCSNCGGDVSGPAPDEQPPLLPDDTKDWPVPPELRAGCSDPDIVEE